MSASTLSIRARLAGAISGVISGIHNARDICSSGSVRGPRNLRVEELEERILFGYYSANPPWESPSPLTPSTTCPTANGGAGSSGAAAAAAAAAGAAAGAGGPQGGGAGPGKRPLLPSYSAAPRSSPMAALGAAQTSQPVVAMTGLPAVSATDVSSDAMGFTFAHSRSWTGLDNGSFNGNGWSNSELPYLVVGGGTNGASSPGGTIGTGVMTGTSGDSRISVVYGGTVAYTFFNSSGTSFTPFADYGVTLQYISSPTPIIELTDASGNVTEFYDVHRASGTPDP